MAYSEIPPHRRALAVDFYCTVARNNIMDRGEIRMLAADMFGIPKPYKKDSVEALVTYISAHIFDLVGMEKPTSEYQVQEQLRQLIAGNVGSVALLDKSA